MNKEEVNYRHERTIPFYEETIQRSFSSKLIKIKNTLLLFIAYICPSVKLRIICHKLRGVNIGRNCYIGMFCFIDNLYPEYVYFGDNTSLNNGSKLIAHFNPSSRFEGLFEAKVSPIIIKNGAMIAVNCVILPGVTLGEYAVISAGSIVSKSVEAYTLVQGNPARKVINFKHLLKKIPEMDNN